MTTRAQAVARVDRHVEPKSCFVTTDNGRDWRPLEGTGCAHYVAHRLGITGGTPGSNACMDGYVLRVPRLVQGMTLVGSADVQVNDVWTNAGQTHCGIVSAVAAAANAGGAPTITITHCSSRQGGVVSNDWATFFHGQGRFHRQAQTASRSTRGSRWIASGTNSSHPVTEAFS